MVYAEPIRLIETYTFRFLGPIFSLYSTFNRDICKIHKPIRLIESILIIETQEYMRQGRALMYVCKKLQFIYPEMSE